MSEPRFEVWRIRTSGSDYNLRKVQDAYARAKVSRAEVIDAMTLVELELNEVLCTALSGTDKARRELLSNCVLTAEFCSLFQKWRMLRAFLSQTTIDSTDRRLKLTQLKQLIGQRNAFAHGEIVVDTQSLASTLTYREGERVSVVLDDDLVRSILANAFEIFQWLQNLQQAAPTSGSERGV